MLVLRKKKKQQKLLFLANTITVYTIIKVLNSLEKQTKIWLRITKCSTRI